MGGLGGSCGLLGALGGLGAPKWVRGLISSQINMALQFLAILFVIEKLFSRFNMLIIPV